MYLTIFMFEFSNFVHFFYTFYSFWGLIFYLKNLFNCRDDGNYFLSRIAAIAINGWRGLSRFTSHSWFLLQWVNQTTKKRPNLLKLKVNLRLLQDPNYFFHFPATFLSPSVSLCFSLSAQWLLDRQTPPAPAPQVRHLILLP